ncbi:MAG: hypothetical protein ACYC40_02900 [Patescibacteria group bacterium]
MKKRGVVSEIIRVIILAKVIGAIEFVFAAVVSVFFLILMFGILKPADPAISGNFLSDNWIHTPHYFLALICLPFVVYYWVPNKYLFFWRKEA